MYIWSSSFEWIHLHCVGMFWGALVSFTEGNKPTYSVLNCVRFIEKNFKKRKRIFCFKVLYGILTICEGSNGRMQSEIFHRMTWRSYENWSGKGSLPLATDWKWYIQARKIFKVSVDLLCWYRNFIRNWKIIPNKFTGILSLPWDLMTMKLLSSPLLI